MPDSVCSIYKEGAELEATSINAGTEITIDTRNFRTGLIAIKNTGTANTLQYKVDGYANYNGVVGAIADKTVTDIAPSSTVTFSFDGVTRAKRIVTITPKVPSSQSTYIIEYCLGL